jgi:hypothetical protein
MKRRPEQIPPIPPQAMMIAEVKARLDWERMFTWAHAMRRGTLAVAPPNARKTPV